MEQGGQNVKVGKSSFSKNILLFLIENNIL
jgi:hypothetical protein